MTRTQNTILVAGIAVLALVGVAVGASYMTRNSMETPKQEAQAPKAKVVHRYEPARQTSYVAQPQKPPCDDHNIVGTVGGAVAGGLIGHQFGKGSGKDMATAGGVVAGGALGNAMIPTRGVTCD